MHDLPATPYAEDRPAEHPALWFHLADERTGYVHLTQRDADPGTWQFLSPDPYRSDEAEAAGEADRRRLLGVDGPLAHGATTGPRRTPSAASTRCGGSTRTARSRPAPCSGSSSAASPGTCRRTR